MLGPQPPQPPGRSKTLTRVPDMTACRRLGLAVLLAGGALGCGTQYDNQLLERENRELRSLVSETRSQLQEVKRDQERLRAMVEYLQYAQEYGENPDFAGLDTAAESKNEPWEDGRPEDSGPVGSASAMDTLSLLGSRSPEPLSPGLRPLPGVGGRVERDGESGPEPATNDLGPGGEGGEDVAAEGLAGGDSSEDEGGFPRANEPTSLADFEGFAPIPKALRLSRDETAPADETTDEAAPELPRRVPLTLRGSGYDDGVRALSDGQFDDAVQYFRDFIFKNPSSSYADDAQFWIGEAYFQKGAYSNSIKELNQVVLRYRSGSRGPAALLRLSQVFSRIGDEVDARLSLQKLVNLYPESAEAERAAERLAETAGPGETAPVHALP